jgi:hypothetical protein
MNKPGKQKYIYIMPANCIMAYTGTICDFLKKRYPEFSFISLGNETLVCSRKSSSTNDVAMVVSESPFEVRIGFYEDACRHSNGFSGFEGSLERLASKEGLSYYDRQLTLEKTDCKLSYMMPQIIDIYFGSG